MPKVPKWMANAMESLFSGMYHPVKVTAVDHLAERLRKIRFEGDFSKSKKEFIPGNVIEFRISDTEFRHYTPSYFDQENGVCEVLFYLHDKGPGSRWISGLKIGDDLKLLGPGGKIKYDRNAEVQFVFGDETSLGLFECIASEAKKNGHLFFSIVELDEENMIWQNLPGFNSTVAYKDTMNNASHANEKLDEWLQQNRAEKHNTTFYLTGNAKSILAVKKKLMKAGIGNSNIKTEPYWAEGKEGL